MKNYTVSGCAVLDENGAIVYDLLNDLQEASDICTVLNSGIGPDWDAVEKALPSLVAVKTLLGEV